MGRHDQLAADEVIALLRLEPHPEYGYYRETFRDSTEVGAGRSKSTAIYFLLRQGERSHWHRIDVAEIWHWYAGAPLALSMIEEGRAQAMRLLGPHLDKDEQPQIVVPARVWQSARSLGAYTL